MSNLSNEPNLSLRVSRFNNILISAATTRVGKSKSSRRYKPWITPHVQAKIRNRNRLRQTIHQNRQEWIDACREATEAVNEAKTESWKNLLQDAMSNSDVPNMWKVIQGLNGTPDANSPNEAMSHNGRTITDSKSKANAFINHYARVSKLKMSQSDRDINRQFKKSIKVPSADDESCAPILMSELQSAIKKMKGKGATGPDNIPPSFLKSLGPLALQELLSIFNSSFSLAHCPGIWRVATIIPLLKAGKSPSEVASFRPISLTSCVDKLLERIIAYPLYYIAETNNMFSRFQAGFHKGPSCEDQITQIVQAIEDGFQQRLMQRSVLTLLDFSKAYDTVWREKLLLHMLNTGIPPTFIRWIRSFVTDHRGRVQLFNVFSSSSRFTQGLPQGSVLCFFCSTLTILQLHSTDNVSILTTARKREDAEATAQSVVSSIVTWSQEWKLNLNAEKSEVCPLSTWSNDSSWNPTIFTGNQKVRVNTTPCLFGVILDRSLTFNAHMKKLTTSLASSIHIIRATGHTSWGWCRSTLKMVFHALVRRKLDYAPPPAWQPWLSETNLTNLDRLQNRSLRLITGQPVSTPLEALRLEADVQSYSTCSKRLILKANEKARSSTDDHPKRIAVDINIPQRLQHRQNIIHFPSPPWQQSSSHTGRISTSVPGITSSADDTNIKRQCSLSTIISYQADTLFTPMDPLVEEQETGVLQQSSLEDPLTSLR